MAEESKPGDKAVFEHLWMGVKKEILLSEGRVPIPSLEIAMYVARGMIPPADHELVGVYFDGQFYHS